MYIHYPKTKWLCLLICLAFASPSYAIPLSTASLFQQQPGDQLITGIIRVYGKNGRPEAVPGINVIEKGTRNGTVTDAAGAYTLRVKPGATITFSMVGYKTREVKVQPGQPISIILDEDVSSLKEVVVTGYQTIDRKLFTGAAASVKASDVKRDGIADVSRMLEGQVAGVSVQNVSGTFGAAPKIRIRGATSITGDNKPLWVVDGVVLEDVINVSNEQLSTGNPATLLGSSVAGLNPDDIESFQILKDAAATALYGARAMNGVVVITTKKGRIGKPVISYTGNFSTYLKPTYDQFDIMNSDDQMALYNELALKGWLNHSDATRAENGGVYTKMYQLIDTYDATSGQFGLPNTPESRRQFLERYAKANTNWFDVLFKNSFMQEHSLSVSSGTDRSQLYMSTSFLQDNGWTLADKLKRFTGNVRANYNVSDKVSFGLITQAVIRDQRVPGTLNRNSNPVSGQFDRDFDINPYSYSLNASRTLTAYDEKGKLEYFTRNFAPFNIVNEMSNNYIDLSQLDIKLQGDFSYKILKNLKYTFLGNIRYVKSSQEHKIKENSNMPQAYRAAGDATIRSRNRFLYRNPDDPEAEPVVVLPYGGIYTTEDDYLVSYYLRNTVEWSKTWNDKHMVNFLGSQELRYANRQNRQFDGYGYQFDKGGVPYIDPNIIKQNVENNFNYYSMSMNYDRYLAYLANAAYSYKGKYNLNASIRYDGSNLLGESRTARWLPTWNVSGSWNVDTEDFMRSLPDLNRLTLRATYGLTGSMGNARNSAIVLQNRSANRPYLSEIESVIYIQSLENSELTWEKQYETNVGIDAGLFQDKLSITVDGYLRKGFDLIGPIRTGGIGGEEIKIANYGDMKSHGVEATIGYNIINKTDWGLRTQLTLGYNKGKITNLKNMPIIWDLVVAEGGAQVGRPVRGLYSIPFAGLDPKDGTPLFINQDSAKSGNVYLQSDKTGNLHYDGPVDPTLTGGWYNTLRYKNLSLSALVTYSTGNKVRLNPGFKQQYSDLDASSNDFLNRWTLPGDELLTNVPSILDKLGESRLDGAFPYNNYNYSTARVADGSFIRLKQVSLSYNLPPKTLTRAGFNNLSVSLVANNVWLIYSDKKLNGQDPEFFNAGGVALPIPRQFTLSLKAGL
ncbi:SusC/RagA family TonB-linked outer membrane protein [Chitinophaga tropicalis]|uniref:SusC/RagA family TonB-linked outer membrane protein n=1 Tax=Chitinophaga tropicalis TaxID=2683588 RepID=A0A7K1U1D8_9BACT|nr:SusC/RagA family TonB-linked outer membrane protein [Chitinophaga tropicalis]MVT08153.1 SusC/RagA family TonB-linked outer membrane protein [Chitinophaga tropicalis]